MTDAFCEINYERWDTGGDMWDDIHPFETGYAKMADLWYTRLLEILPQADAGPDQDVNEFENVTLDASGCSDPKSGTLTYQWVQSAGTPVVLSDDQAVQPTFVAPIVGPGTETLTFKITVMDADNLESTDTIDTNLANAGIVKTVTSVSSDITVASNFSSAHAVIDVLGYYYLSP
jgi:hypothetical protein